jgi:inorganic pyrophosphatase
MDDAFWNALDTLIATSEIAIDRPRGSAHPRYADITYPLDYGYLTGTSGGDGDEIDIWRGSLPDGRLDAVVCTVDTHKRDAEMKLLIGCSAQEEQTILDFHHGPGVGATIVRRDKSPSSLPESAGERYPTR